MIDTTITIGKKEIAVKEGLMPHTQLKFFPENPRIYSIITGTGKLHSQDDIEQKLIDMEHVKQLVTSIRDNGGLTDPVIVRDGDFVVLEGNSRLAAYRALSKFDPIKWGKLKVKLLPKDIAEDQVFTLLGQYHIIGRKDWQPYEQAGYLYRRNKTHRIDPSDIAREIGLPVQTIRHYIEVYDFMLRHSDTDVKHWSFYDEYLKTRAFQSARKADPGIDAIVVKKVKKNEIPRAIDIREKMQPIFVSGGSILRGFLEKDSSLEDAYERASARGIDNVWYKRLHKFREFLVSDEAKGSFAEMDNAHLKKCKFELKKIKTAIDELMSPD